MSFRLTDSGSGLPRSGLRDVRVLYYMVPALHRTEFPAREISDGIYEAILTLPEAGAYYIYVAVPSAKVRYGDIAYTTLQATSEKSAAGSPETAGAGRPRGEP